MIITREKGMRMWGGGSGSTSASGVNGGGGFSLAVTEGEGTGNAYTGFTYESGVLSLIKGEKFVTVDFFNRLFTAYDSDGNAILPNDITSTINNLKLLVGTWTEEYLSALGKNSEGGGGGGGIELSDVWQSLKTNTDDYANQKINSAHIPDLSGTYATKTWVNQQGFVTSSGVTSVAMTVPTGLSVSGTPITTTGTLALTFATGYSIPTTAKQGNWDTAYSWGNHATAGYASASSVTTLQGYFTNGVAKTAAKLNTGTTTYTAWGQTYWSSGVPQSISGNMTSVGSITPSANGNALGTTSARFNIYGTAGNFSGNVSISGTLGVSGATTLSSSLSVASGITLTTTKKIYFGDTSHYLELNSTGFHFSHGVYSDSFVSALGANSSGGGGGGIDIEAMWTELQGNTGSYANAKINVNHIPDISSTYGYAKTSQLGNYLPLTGGTITLASIDGLTINKSSNAAGMIRFTNGSTLLGYLGFYGTETPACNIGGNYRALLHTGNYNSYAPTLTGTGASGTWGISITGNAATATTLATPRTIWGQSFNGSANITGALSSVTSITMSSHINMANNTSIRSTDTGGTTRAIVSYNSSNHLYLGYDVPASGGSTFIYGTNIGFRTNGTGTANQAMYITPEQNVGIGTTTPGYKLGVVGTFGATGAAEFGSSLSVTGSIIAKNGIYINNAKALYYKDTEDTNREAFVLSNSNSLSIGYGTSGAGYDTYISGNNLYLRYGTSRTIGLALTSAGKVGIGTSSPSFKLQVENTSGWALRIHSNDGTNWGTLLAGHTSAGLWCGVSSTSSSNYIAQFRKGTTGAGSGGSEVLFIRADGCVGIDTASPSYALHVVGTIYGSGEITAASDARAKNILGNVNLDLKYMADAPNILYEWKDKKQHDDNIHVGSLAQYWLKDEKAKYLVSQGKDNGEYSLNYGALATSMAISIAKEVVKHDDEITRLKKEVVKLRERVAELEERRI